MAISTNTLEQLRAGSHEAYKEVYTELYNMIYTLLLRITISKADAEDVAQEAFVRLWENRHKIDSERDIRALLYTTARNYVFDQLERKKVRRKYNHSGVGDGIEYVNSHNILVAKEIELMKELVISRMSEQRRRIYRMSAEDGMGADEIARELGISREAVYNQVSAAKRDLREHISLLLLFFIL